MRVLSAVFLLALFGPSLQAQKIVNPNSCTGRELQRDEVLLIDVSESLDIEAAIAEAVSRYRLKPVKQRLVETEMAVSMNGAFRKAARIAGKERCDAVIVVGKGVGREQVSAFVASSDSFTGYSLPDEDEWVAVIFADIEEDAAPGSE